MRFTLAASFTLFATLAAAQDQPNTVLVMDGSGSMWGQVDGVAKITIAQEVVGNLLSDFPAEQGLGLTVYGHRERGVCTDIETVVAPAPGTAGQITDAVKAIKPLGKTPMTDAVIAAAEALRYTEDKATVILVSDGVETCNPDPCAAARLLEEAGIDFTAHVIGFDVGSDPEALAQMQCIADETGGQFLTADTADQLTEALTQVAVVEPEPESEPALVPTTLTAVFEGTETLVPDPVIWEVSSATETVLSDTDGNPLSIELEEGSYTLIVYSPVLEVELNRQFIAIGDSATVEVAFPEPKETARLIAPSTAVAGSTIEVGWDGPNFEEDYIGIGPVDATGATQWKNWASTASGNPVSLLVPPVAGPHLIQYFKREGRESLGAVEIMVTPAEATITAPPEGVAGSEIEIGWTGPLYADDYIGIGRVDADGANRWENWVPASADQPTKLLVPAEPGAYEITYFMRQDRTPVTTVAFTATDVTASIIAPQQAVAGSEIEIGWTGPNYEEDYIGVGRVDATGANQWENWVRTSEGSPTKLVMPATAGDYVITYFQRQDRTPLAQVPITLTEPEARLVAPSEAQVGSTIEVGWVGPDYPEDYIGIGKPDATGANQWENWAYTRDGNPAEVKMPGEAGDYVITYFMRQDRTPLAQVPITLKPAEVTLSAPSQAEVGSRIEVTWTGPDSPDDYIGIGHVGASGANAWKSYAYTRDGNPARINAPGETGDYLITYFLSEGRTPLKQIPIALVAPEVTMQPPAEAFGGSLIEIPWSGPDNPDDYVGIGKADASGGNRWKSFAYTRDGSPARITVPAEPGDYLVTYFLSQDRTAVLEIPLTVKQSDARLIAPQTVAPGQQIEIGWSGPDNRDDYIGIGPADAAWGGGQWRRYAYTRDGNPARLTAPTEPGTYTVRYFLQQDRYAIAEETLIVE
ncbi:VWA domain-containing protein [Marivita hallyeonensis]|uniref:Ca-activated chloride channel family protein n=1 Tax=Marivita hallyeonensis TaxID=996342 RepID=A0A1M5XE37_9RHOB|nr:VWA domain-containing protein [Marivita hallyeonensis]SHH98145.1 Ca-activated chloride channel family protein [Marivita hallyeonensis]